MPLSYAAHPESAHMKHYVTDRQLEVRYQVHRTTVWRWVREGVIPRPEEIAPGTTRWNLGSSSA